MKNLSKAYYKDYFSGVDFKLVTNPDTKQNEIVADSQKVKGKNSKLIHKLANAEYVREAKKTFFSGDASGLQEFSLEVRYPGLVTGIGFNHEAGVDGEFKLGVHMDYTSGLPVIYGSSVKGVLRDAFRYDNLFGVLLEIFPEHKQNIAELQNKFKSKTLAQWTKEIFGDDKSNDKDPRSVYQRDIFFDAIVCKANDAGRILSADSITPHNGPLKNPTPITFVKIASGCKIKFRFHLKDSDGVTADDKMSLFKYILMAFGAGAKTNVGYGQLADTNCCYIQCHLRTVK